MDQQSRAEVRDGFVRQRRALVAVSLVLVTLQAIGASLDHLELLGNTINLNRPVPLAGPLWVAWGYFLLRYYQYFHDVGDSGFRAAVERRRRTLARRAAISKLQHTVHPDVSECSKPRWWIEVPTLEVLDAPPSSWKLKAVRGYIHIRDAARPTWGATQLIDDLEVSLPPGVPRMATSRAVIWSGVHTRYFTEYGLPFVVASAPVVVVLLSLAGVRVSL
jgi:hypothetical protein